MASGGSFMGGVGFAAIGAAIGASIWAGIGYATGYEIGWIAWGVGGLVGILAVAGGARGAGGGMTAAGFAAAAIIAGKLLATHFTLESYIVNASEEGEWRQAYAEEVSDANQFANISEMNYPEFMVKHGYTEATTASEISREELEDFKVSTAPYLWKLKADQPTYEQWVEDRRQMVREYVGNNMTLTDRLNLGPIDILFFLLGIGTAFSIVTKREE